jgi:hypothetical protein
MSQATEQPQQNEKNAVLDQYYRQLENIAQEINNDLQVFY